MKGATLGNFAKLWVVDVSIHAPNEGSDYLVIVMEKRMLFQSTLPMKGATRIPN